MIRIRPSPARMARPRAEAGATMVVTPTSTQGTSAAASWNTLASTAPARCLAQRARPRPPMDVPWPRDRPMLRRPAGLVPATPHRRHARHARNITGAGDLRRGPCRPQQPGRALSLLPLRPGGHRPARHSELALVHGEELRLTPSARGTRSAAPPWHQPHHPGTRDRSRWISAAGGRGRCAVPMRPMPA